MDRVISESKTRLTPDRRFRYRVDDSGVACSSLQVVLERQWAMSRERNREE